MSEVPNCCYCVDLEYGVTMLGLMSVVFGMVMAIMHSYTIGISSLLMGLLLGIGGAFRILYAIQLALAMSVILYMAEFILLCWIIAYEFDGNEIGVIVR